MTNGTPSRRVFLAAIGSAGVIGLSGCSTNPFEDTTERQTPVDDQPPRITSYGASPREAGTALEVHLEGEDQRGLREAQIVYGERVLNRQLDGKTTIIDGQLQNTASTTPEDGSVHFSLTDTRGNTSRLRVELDQQPPELKLEANPTAKAGVIDLILEAQDDVGLTQVWILDDDNVVRESEGTGTDQHKLRSSHSVSRNRRFQQTTVGGGAEDWNGNRAKLETESYVRQYDRDLENFRFDIGVDYMPQMGRAFRRGCVERKEPEVGDYSEPIQPETVSKHIDQMTGHGIPRLNYAYQGFAQSPERLRTFVKSEMVDQIGVAPRYNQNAFISTMNRSWKDDVVPEVMTNLREYLLKNDDVSIATYEERPVIETWGMDTFLYWDELGTKLLDEWGSYESFVQDIRSQLTVGGVNPFMIGGLGRMPYHMPEGIELGTQFDAVTHWFGPLGEYVGETYEWSDVLPRVKRDWDKHLQFANEYEKEFIPKVYPGFDDRGNHCWGPDQKRHIPRSQPRFMEMLQLAEEYATTDMIDIATWNDWAEGTQIEPGIYRGNDYGTDYIEIIAAFQRPNAD